ncbi:MAG: hypothetical protein RR514_07700, partial [Christensenella sp.]
MNDIEKAISDLQQHLGILDIRLKRYPESCNAEYISKIGSFDLAIKALEEKAERDKMNEKPIHCFGAMDWILKYPIDKIPNTAICSCAYKTKCLELTNLKRKAESEGKAMNKTCSNCKFSCDEDISNCLCTNCKSDRYAD